MNKNKLPLPKARKSQLISKEVAGELVVYDRQTDRAYCLNSTAAFVWTHCDGQTSVAQMAQMLEAEIKTPVEHDVVFYALDQLNKAKLLSDSYHVTAPKQFMSRRTVMRLGVASAVVLPLISGITAPTAAQSGTCLPSGASCMSDGACCSNSCVDNGRGEFQCA